MKILPSVRAPNLLVVDVSTRRVLGLTGCGHERAAVVVHLTVADMCVEAEGSDAAGRYSGPEPAKPDAVDTADGDEPERAAVVNRLLCSGRIRTAVHDTGGDLLDLGRSHRVVTDRLFRALLMCDGGCAHLGCGATRGLQAHHVRHRIDGGRTHLANLGQLTTKRVTERSRAVTSGAASTAAIMRSRETTL